MNLKTWITVFIAVAQSATVTVTSTGDFRIGGITTSAPTGTTAAAAAAATTTFGGGIYESDIESDHDHDDHDHGSATTTATGQTTAITDCHFHEETQYCVNGDKVEGYIVPAPTETSSAPEEYTGCHSHGDETYCLKENGDEVQFVSLGSEASSADQEDAAEFGGAEGVTCHFHAGVEHCVDANGRTVNRSGADSCTAPDYDYNTRLRVGCLFAILATSALGVYLPILTNKFLNFSLNGVIFTGFRQFGTGVIISTAFVHLITHAEMMWSNECMAPLDYEATGTSITMAGIFLCFAIEYFIKRIALARLKKADSQNPQEDIEVTDQNPKENELSDSSSSLERGGAVVVPALSRKISVIMLEAGIIFHSILIGVTLVVAGDSFFITLFIVIIFHQMFEGFALGTKIAELDMIPLWHKLLMAFGFAIVTPVGMAIGIGVLSTFNGNSSSTLIALGTLDSFSAGILIWTGLVEMWAGDWIYGALVNANWLNTTVGFISLVAGMILMSVLGKWA
ncbi:BA75_00549T0 [Komagataella pastoris]|uniref:BA75_00549T0 n=1 Tax=Komagataella pastoris TaxID=4922 RepID=A0A1B2J7E7_PICPA|nr:BA75_00549T0 [Komagataella pastoris]